MRAAAFLLATTLPQFTQKSGLYCSYLYLQLISIIILAYIHPCNCFGPKVDTGMVGNDDISIISHPLSFPDLG